jgi:N-acyl-D-aspartate/D-glutamate deacylase
LTSRPAEVAGIADRGRLAVGLPADIVIFDADKIGCSSLRRVNDLPAGADRLIADATGIEAVIVNGTVIRRANRDMLTAADELPGRLLRAAGAGLGGRLEGEG